MSEEVKSFVVYDDIEDVLNELTDEQVGQLFRGMVSYHKSGTDPRLTGVLKYVFIPIKQGIDRNNEKYAKRCEKNRENIRRRWEKEHQDDSDDTNEYERIRKIRTYTNDTNTNTNTNNNNNNNSNNNNNNKSAGADVWAISSSIISFLNTRAGTSYKTDAADSVRLITELIQSGYTEEQMRTVVEKKCGQWLGDEKMESYIRPATLFKQENFDRYLNEPDTARRQKAEEKRKRDEDAEKRREQISELKAERDRLQEEHDLAKGNIGRQIDIRGKIAIIDAKLEALSVRAS